MNNYSVSDSLVKRLCVLAAVFALVVAQAPSAKSPTPASPIGSSQDEYEVKSPSSISLSDFNEEEIQGWIPWIIGGVMSVASVLIVIAIILAILAGVAFGIYKFKQSKDKSAPRRRSRREEVFYDIETPIV